MITDSYDNESNAKINPKLEENRLKNIEINNCPYIHILNTHRLNWQACISIQHWLLFYLSF